MRKRFRKKSKFEDERVIAKGVISKIDYQNQPVGDRFKTVFYVPTPYCPEGRMCVKWGHSNISVGDEIEMDGRYNDGIFLCWSLKIHKRNENEDKKEC